MLTKVGRSIGSVIPISGRTMPIDGNSEVCGGPKRMICAGYVLTHSQITWKLSAQWGQNLKTHPSFVKFIGAMVEHARGAQTGPCPLCKVQEDQHDYATCLQTVSLEMKGDELSVTTNRPSPRNPQLDPNPLGPTPGMTPKTPQSGPMPKSPSGGTLNKPAIMKGQYTCYG